MKRPIRVALYEDSLFMRGIARSLEGAPDLVVDQIQADAPDACPPDEVSGACLLAFDIHEASPELMLAQDPEDDLLMVLSGWTSGARIIGDLMEVIRRHGEVEEESGTRAPGKAGA